MSSDHWHYARDIHGAAEEHHRHYDLERDIEGSKEHEHDAGKIHVGSSKGYLPDVLTDLENRLQAALDRIAALERQTPAALRSQRELDETLADNAAAGYGQDGW